MSACLAAGGFSDSRMTVITPIKVVQGYFQTFKDVGTFPGPASSYLVLRMTTSRRKSTKPCSTA